MLWPLSQFHFRVLAIAQSLVYQYYYTFFFFFENFCQTFFLHTCLLIEPHLLSCNSCFCLSSTFFVCQQWFSSILVTAMNGNTIHPANTTSAGGGPSVAAPPRGWREFCELHAIATARQLAGHYRSFAREHPQHDVVPPEAFSKHFTDLFQHHFGYEVDKDGTPLSQSTAAPVSASSTSSLASPLPPHTVNSRLRISSLSGAQDYREAGRPSGGAAPISVAPKVESVVVSREQEQPLRCAARNSFSESLSIGSRSLLIHSHSNDEISGADHHQVSERYSSESLASSPGLSDVTHFSVSQIQQTVRRLFQKRTYSSPRSSQDLSPSNPTTNSNPPNNGHRVGGIFSANEEGSSSSSSSHSSSFVVSEATPTAASNRPGVVSHLLDGFRWFRSRSMRQRRPEGSGCCKEGQLKYLLVDDTILDSQPHWQRCRLLVRRIRDTQSGGGSERYQLELYDPPKVETRACWDYHTLTIRHIFRDHFLQFWHHFFL